MREKKELRKVTKKERNGECKLMILNLKTEGKSLMCHLMIKIKCENEQERKMNIERKIQAQRAEK